MERLTIKSIFGGWTIHVPRQEAIDRLAAYEDAMPIERAQELAQAEKDGRLIVLPVKEGTKIYRLSYRLGGTYAIDERFFSLTYFRHEDFGKTLFLTREEAEAALKKRGEVDNEAN